MVASQRHELRLLGEAATLAFGAAVASGSESGLTVYLHGELGAGKTTWVRGFLQALGHRGNVKSPTYTLVEEYVLDKVKIYHFDLYRLADPEELEFIGVRDYLRQENTCIIEWPERGQPLLPVPDLEIWLDYDGDAARRARLETATERGRLVMQNLIGGALRE